MISDNLIIIIINLLGPCVSKIFKQRMTNRKIGYEKVIFILFKRIYKNKKSYYCFHKYSYLFAVI
jgi:hypothetical protein